MHPRWVFYHSTPSATATFFFFDFVILQVLFSIKLVSLSFHCTVYCSVDPTWLYILIDFAREIQKGPLQRRNCFIKNWDCLGSSEPRASEPRKKVGEVWWSRWLNLWAALWFIYRNVVKWTRRVVLTVRVTKPFSLKFIEINPFLFFFVWSATRWLQAEPTEHGGGSRGDCYSGVSASTWTSWTHHLLEER